MRKIGRILSYFYQGLLVIKRNCQLAGLIMVKPIMIIAGSIPAIIALLIAIPLITQPEIPFTAIDPSDKIEFEYTKHDLKNVSFGVTERVAAQKTQVLVIKNDRSVRYTLIEGGVPYPDKAYEIDEEKLRKLTALIKETGFMTIQSESFPIRDDVDEYQKSTLKITLNGIVNQIHWPEQNVTEKFVPPIITMVEAELDQIINEIK